MFAYAGNTAWAFIKAAQTMKQNEAVGGEAFFISDNTPLGTMPQIAEPFLNACGYTVSKWQFPFWAFYCILCIIQLLCILVRPLVKVGPPSAWTRGSMMFLRRNLSFKRDKAETQLGYKPIYSFQQALERSAPFYAKVTV